MSTTFTVAEPDGLKMVPDLFINGHVESIRSGGGCVLKTKRRVRGEFRQEFTDHEIQ